MPKSYLGNKIKERKAGESQLKTAIRHAGYDARKMADATTCPRCGMFIPKTSFGLDYVVSPINQMFWVEVKESGSDGRLVIKDLFRPLQRARMDKEESYVFLEVRDNVDATRPSGVSAYFFPWEVWRDYVEVYCESIGVKSLKRIATKRLPGTDDILSEYRLEWKKADGDNAGHWIIPEGFRKNEH
jgi:hypothetical protein